MACVLLEGSECAVGDSGPWICVLEFFCGMWRSPLASPCARALPLAEASDPTVSVV